MGFTCGLRISQINMVDKSWTKHQFSFSNFVSRCVFFWTSGERQFHISDSRIHFQNKLKFELFLIRTIKIKSHNDLDELLLGGRKRVTKSSNFINGSVTPFKVGSGNSEALVNPSFLFLLQCLGSCPLGARFELLDQFLFSLSYQVAISVLEVLNNIVKLAF